MTLETVSFAFLAVLELFDCVAVAAAGFVGLDAVFHNDDAAPDAEAILAEALADADLAKAALFMQRDTRDIFLKQVGLDAPDAVFDGLVNSGP